MVIASFPPERNVLKEARCPLVRDMYIYGKHIKMYITPEVCLNHFQLFIWWKVRNIMSSKELLYCKVYAQNLVSLFLHEGQNTVQLVRDQSH